MNRQRFSSQPGRVMVLSLGLLLMTSASSAQTAQHGRKDGRNDSQNLSGVTQNWDKVLRAAERFVILSAFSNEAVRDNETGLVRQRTPEAFARPWSEARTVCAERPVGSRFGWRLPSVHELLSLLDPTTNNPSLPAGHPFLNVQPSLYWSATTSAEDPSLAWFVGLYIANLSSPNSKSQTYYYSCVRGGGTLSEY